MISWFKPKNVTWRDWWSSRTNQAITMVTSVYMAIISGAVTLTDLGIPDNWNRFFLSVMGVITALGMFKLRTITTKPLKGRSQNDSDN